MKKENSKFDLFSTFFKIGLFTFGGGYAMISLMQREVVENKKWITSEDMSDMITISESTPGPVSVNVATFVGYKVAGVLGALCSTLGVVVPSFLIIVFLSGVLDALKVTSISFIIDFSVESTISYLLHGKLVRHQYHM